MDKQIQGKGRDLGPRNYVLSLPSAFFIPFVCLPFLELPLSGASLTPAKAGNSAMMTGRTAVPRHINGVGDWPPVVRPLWSRCTLGIVVFLALTPPGPETRRVRVGQERTSFQQLIPAGVCENRKMLRLGDRIVPSSKY